MLFLFILCYTLSFELTHHVFDSSPFSSCICFCAGDDTTWFSYWLFWVAFTFCWLYLHNRKVGWKKKNCSLESSYGEVALGVVFASFLWLIYITPSGTNALQNDMGKKKRYFSIMAVLQCKCEVVYLYTYVLFKLGIHMIQARIVHQLISKIIEYNTMIIPLYNSTLDQ